MAVWIVRGGSDVADAEKDFLESGSVGIYFGVDQSMDRMSDAVLREEIECSYTCWCKERQVQFRRGVVTFFLNQMLAFRDGIQQGDTILMPRKASRGHKVAQGIANGGYEYWGQADDYRHRRRVQWLETEMPRENVGMEWYPSDRRTVFRISEFG